MSKPKPTIVHVAIPSPLRRVFDYLPGNMNLAALRPGMRVKVPFARKHLFGVIIAIDDLCAIDISKLKNLMEVVDDQPLLPSALLKLLTWAADYYQAPIGEVMQQALPVLLRKGEPAQTEQQFFYQLSSKGEQTESDDLKRAPKQWQTLKCLQDLQIKAVGHHGISHEKLSQHGITRSDLKILIEKELVIEKKINKIIEINKMQLAGPVLHPEQEDAVNSIVAAQNSFKAFLLDGITGSGKTEVYLNVILQMLQNGGQALVLVPEIGLTPQTIARFSERLPYSIALLHSGLSDSERRDTWIMAKNGDISVVIGTRSAIFTPFSDLKCIVVDESHDVSFKQWEGFKYNARDLAVVRAQIMQVPVILGSATPSLGSLHNVISGRFKELKLTQRAGNAQLPQFRVVDMRRQKLQDGIAVEVLGAIKQHLQLGNQVLVFLNRRGFAPVLMCHDCGWVSECKRCHAPMTIHHSPAQLLCHHCGKQQSLYQQCPECEGTQLINVGLGTEKVHQVLQTNFKDKTIARIDKDSTRKKGTLENKLAAIHSGHAQILVGTQMLAKGHHFPNVTLVVMLDIDGGLYSADFNASERMAQLLLQVAGRAGRAEKAGEVLLQTHHPDHPLLNSLINAGYNAFAKTLLKERQEAHLPPYVFLTLFRVEALQNEMAEIFLEELKNILQSVIDEAQYAVQIFGPLKAPIEKRVGRYRWQLLLSANKRSNLHALLKNTIPQIETLKTARKVRWSLDVDPIDML